MTKNQTNRRSPALLLCASLLTTALQVAQARTQAQPERQLPTVQDTMAQRMQACVVCHGQEGRATNQGYFPRIAGKPAGYLTNQLINFREGRRNNAAMMYLVEHLSDDYLREIGHYFGALDLPYPPPQPIAASPAVLARGRVLVVEGDAGRGIPSCVQCHGQKMTGVLPAIPGLLGLPRDYLVAQFGAWRTGQRRAVQPDCMHTIATRLAPEDITAVAGWLAAQPLPADPKPAPRLAAPLPMPCGSGLQ